ncbi:hypothetical protein niasHT_027859 [Heterodera trifolii]|uniref:Glycosyl hydrolase family 13 catalytic domain-containing protein n=1 Tax=Heterodera trifolii TaxID=157864 RepID=A0ABD2JKF1_9BILA
MPATKCPPRLFLAHKSNSYIFAVEHNAIQTPLSPSPLCVSELFSDDGTVFRGPGTPFSGATGQLLLIPGKQRPPLSVEQIERYRNVKKWRRKRLTFYSVLWLGSLFSLMFALFLVHIHPKCAPSSSLSREWWKDTLIYEIWTLSYHGNLVRMMEMVFKTLDFVMGVDLDFRLGHLRRIGVGAVFLRPILRTESTGMGVIDFTALSQQIDATMEQFDAFVDAAHRKGIRVLLDLPLAVTSIAHLWFRRSALAARPENAPFADYYHWRRSAVPSNSAFVSAFDGSMLKYFHVANRADLPVLNWQNSNGLSAVRTALSFWLGHGVDGFHLAGIDYLHRTADGRRPSWDEIVAILKSFKTHAEEQWRIRRRDGERKIFLFTSHEHLSEALKVRLVDEVGLDAVVNTELRDLALGNRVCANKTAHAVPAMSVAECANEILADLLLFHQSFTNVWPLWSVGGPFARRLTSRVDGKVYAELIMLLQLTLPGTTIIYYGDELGLRDVQNLKFPQRGPMPWDSSSPFDNRTDGAGSIETNFEDELADSRSFLHSVRAMARLRLRDAALRADGTADGRTYITKRVDGQAFALCRYLCCREEEKKRNGGDVSQQQRMSTTVYGDSVVVLVNFGPTPLTFSLSDLPPFHRRGVYRRGRIVARSANTASKFALGLGIELDGRQVHIGVGQGIVFKAFEF